MANKWKLWAVKFLRQIWFQTRRLVHTYLWQVRYNAAFRFIMWNFVLTTNSVLLVVIVGRDGCSSLWKWSPHLVGGTCPLFLCVHAGREQLSALVENAISGNSLGTLIRQPSGCGEQNMMRMTLPVIATVYLDKTHQWETVGFDKRDEALQHIRTGRLTQIH